MGLNVFCATNEGRKVPIPQFYRKVEKQLVELQRDIDRKKHKRTKEDKTKPSQRYKQARTQLVKFHEKIANKRNDFVYKLVN